MELSTLEEMGSYGKNGALWRPACQLRGWCADGEQAFSESPKELSGGGRKAELHPNSCRDLDAKYVENIPYASQT